MSAGWNRELPVAVPGGMRQNPHEPDPDRVYIPQNYGAFETVRESRELSPPDAVFYSQENVSRLQAICEQNGFGRPTPWFLKPYMDMAVEQTRGEYNAMVYLSTLPSMQDYLARLNQFVINAAWPTMLGNCLGQSAYLRDITYRVISDNPADHEYGARRKDFFPDHPYWSSMQ